MICTGQVEQAACKSYDDVGIIGVPLLNRYQINLSAVTIIHKKLIDYWNN